MLALPDRADFDEAADGRAGPEGSLRRPVPDYDLLLSTLRSARCGGLCVARIGTVPSAEAGTAASEVHVFLIGCPGRR